MPNIKTREGYEWWDQFVKLPRYSFIAGADQRGRFRVEKILTSTGNYVEQHEIGSLIEAMQEEINLLRGK